MTSSSLLVPLNNPSRPNISNSPFSARSNRVNINWPAITIYCASRLRRMPMVVVRAEQTPTLAIPEDPQQVNPDDKRINSKGSNTGGRSNMLIQNFLSGAKWFVWSFLAFYPSYKNFLIVEDRIEKTATTVLNVVESVAEVVDKVAEDVEKSLPENSSLKKVAQEVEKMAEEVEKDAELLESLVEKVDGIVDKFDQMVEPILKEKIALEGRKNIYRRN
ncbi:uncharacterized protein LOC144559643 [Carex rostrata]